jgi:hypothetical protein|nr:MAG TPA: hypothetical protein [Caudoviricetes sp.]
MEKLLKYSKFKKALFGVPGFVFFELEDGMGADVDIENKAIELRPLADLRVYKNVYTGEITKPTKEEIEKAKEVLENPDFVIKGPFYDDFYDKDSDIYKSVQRGERLI